MNRKILNIALIVVLIISLTGCLSAKEPIELEFLTTETGFPIGITRISDGTQIGLGMHIDEIENILYDDERATLIINYYPPDHEIANIISFSGANWRVAGGINIGDNIQSVIMRSDAQLLRHDEIRRNGRIINDFDNPAFILAFAYDTDGKIIFISLSSYDR